MQCCANATGVVHAAGRSLGDSDVTYDRHGAQRVCEIIGLLLCAERQIQAEQLRKLLQHGVVHIIVGVSVTLGRGQS